MKQRVRGCALAVAGYDLLNEPLVSMSAAENAKWGQFSTSSFQPNTNFQNLVRTYTTAGTWSSIRAVANNAFVSADLNQGSTLIANRGTVSAWEKFQVITNPDGTISLMSLPNTKYVSADLNQGGRLIANAIAVGGAWEAFVFATTTP